MYFESFNSQSLLCFLSSGEDLFDHSPEEFDPFDFSDLPSEYSGHIQYSDSQSRVDSKLPDETDSSADWDFPHLILENGGVQDDQGEKHTMCNKSIWYWY